MRSPAFIPAVLSIVLAARPAAADAPAPVDPPPPAAAPAAPAADPDLSERIRDLERIVEDLERKAALQRLSWSADYRVTLSQLHYRGPSPDGARDESGAPRTATLRNLEQWSHRARLSLRADPIPQLRFRARLVAYKRFGDSSIDLVTDMAQSRVPRDSTARFDRFWLDWFLTPELSLSVGRTSATDGSPAELREHMDKPNATLSMGLVDAESDAVTLTYQRGPLVLRGFYLAWQFRHPDDPYAQLPFLARHEAPLRIIGAGLQLRPERRGVPSVELSGYVIPEASGGPAPDLPQPDGSLVRATSAPASMGKIAIATALVLWRDAIPGRLDVFASVGASYVDPNGSAIEYPLGPGGAPVPVLTLASADASRHTGVVGYAGLRLTAPFGGARAPKLGFEATRGSRYLVSYVTPTTDLVARLGVRGRTYDAYLIQPIFSSLFARASWTFLDHDYAPPVGGALGFVEALGGTAPRVAQRLHVLNLMLHASF